MKLLLQVILIGALATLTIDICALFLKHALKQKTTDWAIVGRWFAGLPHGIILHHGIANSPSIKNEAAIGWGMHYLIGIIYSGMYLAIVLLSPLAQPSFLSALSFGLLTVVAPWFILQPGLGMGILAHKTPDPWNKRIFSLFMHTTFGIALYVFWLLIARL